MSQSVLPAILIMSFGMIFIPLGDSAGKTMVAAGVSPLFVAWARFVVGAVAMLPFSRPRILLPLFTDWRIWLRGMLLVLGVSCILTALRTEPLANAFGAFFIGPIISYTLSVWLLKERVTWPRTALLLVGFLGVLLIVQPTGAFSVGLLWAVLAGCFYGAFLTASRWLSDTAPARTLLLSQMCIGSIALAPIALPLWPAIDTVMIGLLLFSGLASMTGNLLLVMAYGRAPASTLAPFVYVQLLSATFFGWLIFGDFPDWISAIGLALLFTSGLATIALRKP